MEGSSGLGLVNKLVEMSGSCVLILFHLLYSLVGFVLDFCLFVIKHVKRYFRTSSISVIKQSICTERFLKIPKHLAVIIEDDEISYFDCIKLILWSVRLEIPYMSFYSCSNAINPTSLYEVLCKVNKRSLQNIKWGKTFHKSVKEMAKKDINGYTWSPEIEINLFSAKSVQESFENVMLRLCQETTKLEDITIDTVDNTFKEEIPIPDPCFGLVFGKTFSTFGFLPWHLRVTEFVHLKTHHNLQDEDFLSALEKFACCEQRFGK